MATLRCWLMVIDGPAEWRFIPAEAPCWKGEIEMSFHWFHVVFGWQSNAGQRAHAGCSADENSLVGARTGVKIPLPVSEIGGTR